MKPLTNKIAIVTGASRSIGRAIAERLAQDGATVAINYRSGADEAKEVIESKVSKRKPRNARGVEISVQSGAILIE